jgi:hypothetical protein
MPFSLHRMSEAAWRRRGDLEVWALIVAIAGSLWLAATSRDEATWLYALPALLVVDLTLLSMVVSSAIKRRQRWKQVMEVAQSKVCPDWFINDAMERAALGGFRREFTEAFLSLGHPPTGVEVARAFQVARNAYMQRAGL